MKTKHTPTPWIHQETPFGTQCDDKIISADGQVIAILNDSRLATQLNKLDAAFIVRAVNSHEAILKGAKHFADCQFQDSEEMACPECELAEEAIKQAEAI